MVYPFVVDIQNALLSDIATRIVIPLGKVSHFNYQLMRGLTPIISYQDEQYVLLTPQIASIPAKLLTKPVGSLEHLRNDISAALDFAVSGI